MPDEYLRAAAELEIACANEGSKYTPAGTRLNMQRVRKTLSDVYDSALDQTAIASGKSALRITKANHTKAEDIAH